MAYNICFKYFEVWNNEKCYYNFSYLKDRISLQFTLTALLEKASHSGI